MATTAEWEATATGLFESFSSQRASVSYTKDAPGTYFPNTDTDNEVVSPVTVDMIMTELTDEAGDPPTKTGVAYFKGSDYRAGGGNSAEPLSTQDTITYDSIVWKIRKIERIPETGSPILYKMTLTTKGK
jgi:hypothetical protein